MPLYSKQAGEGEPLILLHGLFGSLENLGGLARVMAEHFCVYSLDLPNHGRSPHISHISLPVLADSIIEWMDEQGLPRANFLGHSLGGKVAMEVALKAPERVDKLVVMDIAPVQYSAHHDDVFAGLSAITPAALNSRQEAEHILKSYLSDASLRGFLLKNLVKETSGDFSWRMNFPVLKKDYNEILKGNSPGTFNGPSLFIKGELSDYILEAHRHEIISRFPEVQLKVVSGAQHWLHAEKPEIVCAIALRFLRA